jgi:hypothetical protein
MHATTAAPEEDSPGYGTLDYYNPVATPMESIEKVLQYLEIQLYKVQIELKYEIVLNVLIFSTQLFIENHLVIG